MKQKDVITQDMTIDEIFANFPQKGQSLAQEMTNAGLHCVGCHAATWEKLRTLTCLYCKGDNLATSSSLITIPSFLSLANAFWIYIVFHRITAFLSKHFSP